MIIRDYTTTDYQDVLDVYANAKLDEVKLEQNSFTLVPLEKDDKRHKILFESEIFIIDLNGTVIGFGAIKENEVRSIFVHRKARGKGYGEAMLRFLLSRAQYPVSLTLIDSNKPALRLYQKYGFKQIGCFKSDYHGVPTSLIEMQLSTPYNLGS